MKEEIEYYPMPSFPTLTVDDIVKSSRWYQEILGFKLVFEMKGQDETPILVHLRWSKYADVLLVPNKNLNTKEKGVGISLNFAMANNTVDELAGQIKKMNYKIHGSPSNKPWNAREMTILDLDGYRLVFTQPVEIEKSFNAVIKNVKVGKLDD